MPATIRIIATFATLSFVFGVGDLRAQTPGIESAMGSDIAFNAGQSVQPIFEGWSRNSDGSYQFQFGYLNRNFVEEISVPVGGANSITPEGPDRGQPTYFYPRFNRLLFSVRVPADYGKREVIWTLTTHGKTERAVGWLQPEWEIDATAGGLGRPAIKPTSNKPPTLTVASPASPVTVATSVKLVATVKDDGLPAPGKPRVGGDSQGNPPAFTFPEGGAPSVPVNVPQAHPRRRPRIQGLSVSWQVWRGPGAVTFAPEAVAVKDDLAATTATFKVPGDYVLRAIATDTAASTSFDVTIVVSDAARRP